MALKPAKAGEVKKSIAGVNAGNGEVLLEILQREDVTGLIKGFKAFVAPLAAVAGGGKENTSRAELHKLAKQFVPFLVRFLKVCFATVGKEPAGEQGLVQSRGDEVFSAIEIALEGLDSLRSFLTGSPFEIEIQRCAYVRRLLAWRRHSAALVQCRKNFGSLCFHFSAPAEKGSRKQGLAAGPVKGQKRAVTIVAEKKRTVQNFVLPLPEDVEWTTGLPTLVAGIVTDLIWCTGESGPASSYNYQELLSLPQQIEPWLAVLEGDVAEKQRVTLFKGLYKCALVLVANPIQYGAELVEKFSSLTLEICAASSLSTQYAKVAYKLSHCLSHDANSIRSALDVCQAAMKTSLDKPELQHLWTDTDVLELVDCYARLCQTGKQSTEGWNYLCNLVHHTGRSSPSIAAALGFYAVGLNFCSEMIPANPEARCHDLLRDGGAILESCLQQDAEKDRRKIVFCLLKALELIKKQSTKYVQGRWTFFMSECSTNSKVLSQTGTFNSALQRIIHLWYLLLSSASNYKKLTREEELTLKQSWSLAATPVVSMLRLSLMSQQGVQDCVTCISDLLKMGKLQPEELRWMMSSAYNMGIQIYNCKHYDLACYPFRVAYDAGWTRVDVCRQQMRTQPVNIQDGEVCLTEVVNNFMLDSCIKCMTFADSLKRSGKNQAGFEILNDGILRWATIHSTLQPHPTTVPTSLVHVWVRLLHTEGSVNCKSGTIEYSCLYNYLKSRIKDLHQRTAGLLLEEELSALDDLEDEGLDSIQLLKEQNLQILLDNIYTVDDFPIERCRILLEKGRLARLRGHHNVASLSQVVVLLNKTLKDVLEKDSTASQIAGVENQLAMAYCVQAFCAYESDPSGTEFLESIFSALCVWETSARAERTWIGLDVHGDARMEGQIAFCGTSLLRLLLGMNDLLALKGYSIVQYRVQQLLVSSFSAVPKDFNHKIIASLWANSRLSHILCPIAYPSGFFSLLSKKLGVASNSLQFWEKCALICPGTLLDAQLRFMHQEFRDEGHDCNSSEEEGCCQAFKAVENIALSIWKSCPRSSGEVSKLAVLFHILAEHAMEKGNLRFACKYAKEALNMRLRLVSRTFHAGYKGGSPSESDNHNVQTEATDHNKNKAGRLHVLESVATRAWPRLSKHTKQADCDPNPWRVLGDYVESLMQVGVICEKMGAVDDAFASFCEGYSISLAQNLPLAIAAFKSCLGEVQRKRHRWKTAEEDLLLAKEAYENLESAWVCSCCCLTGKASVFLRLGDLARRCKAGDGYPGEDPERDCVRHCRDALSSYVAAQKSLAAISRTVKKGCRCTGCTHSGADARTVPSKMGSDEKLSSNGVLAKHSEVIIHCKEGIVNSQRSVEPALVKSIPVLEPKKLITDCTVDSKQGLLEVDLSASFSNLKLTQHQCKSNKTKAPARKCGNPRQNEAGDILIQDSAMEKRSTRRSKLKNQEPDNMQPDSSSTVIPAMKPVVAGKGTRKRTVVKRYKVEDQTSSDIQITGCKRETVTPTEPDEQDSTAKLANIREKLCSCVVGQGALSSMEEWIAYRWAKYCHQQQARIRIQLGKLHLKLGDTDKALTMFEHASSIVGISAKLLHPSGSFASDSLVEQRRILYPIEEAALFYHKSRLVLQAIQLNENVGYPMGALVPINWLVHAYNLFTQIPPFLRKVSRLLSILHVPVAFGGPGLLHNIDNYTMSERAAYFHQVSVGAGSRQQHLAVLDSKLLGLLSEPEGPSLVGSRDCMTKMQKALTVASINPVRGEHSIRELLKGVPCSTLCCVSLVEKEQAAFLERKQISSGLKSTEASVWLLSTRYSNNSGPVTVLLPAAPLVDGKEHSSERNGNSSPCPYDLDDSEDLKLFSSSITSKVLFDSQRKRTFQTALQEITGAFTSILDESRLSTSGDIDTIEERRQWWRWRLALNTRLQLLLKYMEDSWLGPWKCLLVAEPTSSCIEEGMQTCTKELGSWLRSSCGVSYQDELLWKPHDALVQTLLQGLGSLSKCQIEEGISILQKWIEAFLDELQTSTNKDEHDRMQKRVGIPADAIHSEAVERFSKAYFNLVQLHEKKKNHQFEESVCADVAGSRRTRKQKKEASAKGTTIPECAPSKTGLGAKDLVGTERKSLTLVLDSELQGLPWESLPVLRGYETYRMPSVGSIRALFIHQQLTTAIVSNNLQTKHVAQQAGSSITQFVMDKGALENQLSPGSIAEPCVNPYNTYYVLNPSGDLAKTQQAFEDWFKEQLGWEGKVGQVPTIEEYLEGLQKHDLYTYLGHGSGDQYLPERYVRRLNRCAAALLMGCSSGRFSPRGDYEPVGVPLSYLMAGCPAAIANLWDVTDGDIDRFSRFLLHKWLGTSSEAEPGTSMKVSPDTADQCVEVTGQHVSRKNCRISKSTNKKENQLENITLCDARLRLKMGFFMGECRDFCRLPYLIGASPVYYGVPTSIVRKEIHQSC